MSSRRVAVIDDDPKIRSVIRRSLEPEGFSVDEANDAAGLFRLMQHESYALITLDISLPDGDGFDVARRVRKRVATPIIMITGKGELLDRVVGLELGADDYIAKPFHVRELIARVKAVLRRSQNQEEPANSEDAWAVDSIRVFPARRGIVDENDNEIKLTSSEYNLLLALVEGNGRALSRDTLMSAMRGRDAIALDRSVDNVITRLRKTPSRWASSRPSAPWGTS
jgi:DNA-binding response OmpR family regulator